MQVTATKENGVESIPLKFSHYMRFGQQHYNSGNFFSAAESFSEAAMVAKDGRKYGLMKDAAKKAYDSL